MSAENILKLIKEKEICMVDLRFTDSRGKEQHVSISSKQVNDAFLKEGKMFDGSSIAGWKPINESDMILMPDCNSYYLDPFCEDPTLVMFCNVIEPETMQGYSRCPRSVAMRAEAYLKSTGIADAALFGPEPEFFIFDNVSWSNHMGGASYQIQSEEAAWTSGQLGSEGNKGHRPGIKGGYFPVPPVDSAQDIRTAMSLTLEQIGIEVEAHHHEVATAGQNEIATRFNHLLRKADEVQMLKYVVYNVAHAYGKTATFMAKPLVGDNGSGMHVHTSLSKEGQNIFSGNEYAGLSETALFYIGGIIKHARALNAFTNATTNSYKRLVPGFEAPVMLAYSSRNRSASIRVPYILNPKASRIEIRFPDAVSNPYLSFAALMMAGLDGIQNRIHPGAAMEEDLYELSEAEARDIPTVAVSLEQALEALSHDRAFLLKGGVFTDDLIDAYIKLKMDEVRRVMMATHPIEFELYYSS